MQAHRARLGTRPVHDYQYGGFLLWWLPDEKVFIDGRMPAWRIGDRWIFRDYMDLRETDAPNVRLMEKIRSRLGIGSPGKSLGPHLSESGALAERV